jgi:iron complex transport system substrate-binding protein
VRKKLKTGQGVLLLAAPLALSGLLCATTQAGVRVRDSLGRTVILPARASRVVAVQPEIGRMIVALGAGDALVGMDYTLAARDPLFKLVFPAAGSVPIVSNAENAVNLELLLKLAPDVVFVSPFERRIVEAVERKTRIPVVALASLGEFDALAGEMTLLGSVLGREERAAELVAFFQGEIGRVRDALRGLPESAKPRVYLSFWGQLTRTPVAYAPVEAAGGVNLATGTMPDILGSVQTTVNLERIIRWDPDVVLIHGNYVPADRTMTVERVLADRRLAAIQAVKARRVHYTFGFWDWWDMAEVTLETLYLATLFHPGRFPGFDLLRSGEAIFTRFYGRPEAFAAFFKILGCADWGHDR